VDPDNEKIPPRGRAVRLRFQLHRDKSEIRNDMMTGSYYEPSQNVILSRARRRRAEPKDLRPAFLIPHS